MNLDRSLPFGFALFFLTLTPSTPCHAASLSVDLLIQGGHVIDPRTQTVRDVNIAVDHGKIVAVLPARGGPKIPAKKVIKAQGKWVLPGLHDMHVHPWRGNFSPADGFDSRYDDKASAEAVGYRMLYSGITTYLDLASPSPYGDQPDHPLTHGMNVFDLRRKQQSGAIMNPSVFAAGPAWAVPGSHSAMKAVPNCFRAIEVKDAQGHLLPEQLVTQKLTQALTDYLDQAKPDIIKFIYDNHEDLPSNRPEKMPLYVAQVIIRTAASKGVKTIAHVGSWQAVNDLSAAGITAFTHLPSGAPPKNVVQTLLDHGTVAVSTISVYDDLASMKDPVQLTHYVENSLFKAVTPLPFASTLLDYSKYSESDIAWADWGEKHAANHDQQNAIASLFQSGVTVLPGTDALNTGAIFGYSLHREMKKWDEAGIPKWTILKAATWDSSQFLGQPSGAIAVGKDADLMILRANPLVDISNTQLIDTVVAHGQIFDRDLYLPKMVSGWATTGE